MYLEHFGIHEFPFSLTPNTQYFCYLPGHQQALNVLLLSIRNGEGFVKITGEVGSGKTLLCRKALDSLEAEQFVTAYIPNPDLTPNGLRRALAQELGIEAPAHLDQHALLNLISDKLLALHQQGKQVVLFIDEAQALSDESLEALRLLTNLETEKSKLMQIVLIGQPELDMRLKQNHLRQLRQRITFSFSLSAIKPQDLNSYLCHRLNMAGYTRGSLFSEKAQKLMYHASGGLPRLINILSHKALMVAFGKGSSQVTKDAVKKAILDTEGVQLPRQEAKSWLTIGALVAVLVGIILTYSYYWHLL